MEHSIKTEVCSLEKDTYNCKLITLLKDTEIETLKVLPTQILRLGSSASSQNHMGKL